MGLNQQVAAHQDGRYVAGWQFWRTLPDFLPLRIPAQPIGIFPSYLRYSLTILFWNLSRLQVLEKSHLSALG